MKYILIHGDPVGGYTYTGPFSTPVSAVGYAEERYRDNSWWIATLYEVNDDVAL